MPFRRSLILLLHGLIAWSSLIAGISAAEAHSPASLENPTKTTSRLFRDDFSAPRWRPYSFSTDPCPTGFEAQVVVLINQERTAVGLPPLLIDTQLQNASRRHSEDMAVTDVFSHVGSDGTHSWDRAIEEGYIYKNIQIGDEFVSLFGENIAAGQTTPEQVVADWMASTSGHRELILNANMEHIGVGFIYLDDGKVWNDEGTELDLDHYWTADIGATDEERLAPPLACDPSALRVYLPLVVTH